MTRQRTHADIARPRARLATPHATTRDPARARTTRAVFSVDILARDEPRASIRRARGEIADQRTFPGSTRARENPCVYASNRAREDA